MGFPDRATSRALHSGTPTLENAISVTRLALAVFAAAAAASAQVPEGSAVLCTSTAPGVPGTPGLFVVPLAGGPLQRITGLPPELSTNGNGAYGEGGYSVSIRSADGAVIVGTIAGVASPSGGLVHLFVLHLSGTAVVRTEKIVLGGTTNVGIAANAVLPDGRVLVAAGQRFGPLVYGPMAGSTLAIVDTSGPAPTISPVPGPSVTGFFGGMALDRSGDHVYYLFSSGNFQNTIARLYRYDRVTVTSCALPIATWGGETAIGIRCDDDGVVYVSSTGPASGRHYIHTVTPNGCGQALVSSATSSRALLAAGLDLDRASGRFAAVSSGPLGWVPGISGPQLDALSLIARGGAVQVVASAPAGGWGVINGVAVNNAIESYGPPSDGANHYWFDNFPNPGGQPNATAGNPGFSLTLRAAPGAPLASALWLSAGRAATSLNLLGVEILVAPPILGFPLPAAATVTIPMPIAANPALFGAAFMAQSFHVEPTGLAASRGLEITLQ